MVTPDALFTLFGMFAHDFIKPKPLLNEAKLEKPTTFVVNSSFVSLNTKQISIRKTNFLDFIFHERQQLQTIKLLIAIVVKFIVFFC